jgi:hypothetical protein
MKTKTFVRKLVLNKKTIADITSESMKKVQGGHDSSPTCPIWATCPKTYCPKRCPIEESYPITDCCLTA